MFHWFQGVCSRQIQDEVSETRDPYRRPDLEEPGPGCREHAIRIFPDLLCRSLYLCPSFAITVYPKGITFPLGSCLSWTNSRNLSSGATDFSLGLDRRLIRDQAEAPNGVLHSSIFFYFIAQRNESLENTLYFIGPDHLRCLYRFIRAGRTFDEPEALSFHSHSYRVRT